jgi:putative DNA primase/helicase
VTWDGKPWSKKRGGAVVVYAVETARAIFRDAERTSDSEEQAEITKWAIRSQSAERIKAMVFLVKHQLGASVEEFDSDPYVLNVANGTIDLRAGKLQPHKTPLT